MLAESLFLNTPHRRGAETRLSRYNLAPTPALLPFLLLLVVAKAGRSLVLFLATDLVAATEMPTAVLAFQMLLLASLVVLPVSVCGALCARCGGKRSRFPPRDVTGACARVGVHH